MGSVKPYALMVDTRVESPSASMIHDLETGDIDVALLWGPIAGYYAKHSSAKLHATPLPETPGTRMAFRIAFGVRNSDQNWKRELNNLLAQNKPEIDKILADYGVPTLDEAGQPGGKAP
jgi:ABC-type amino acid transport substrate-binding protein